MMDFIVLHLACPNMLTPVSASSARINRARTTMIQQFLDQEEADWLWLVDTDMRFHPHTVLALLRAAEEKGAKIVAGLCFIYFKDANKMRPNIMFLNEEYGTEVGVRKYKLPLTYPHDSIFEVDATGAACMLVHREVLERMQDQLSDAHPPTEYPWFDEVWDSRSEHYLGPDVVFCERAKALGYKIWYDTRIKIGHMKEVTLGEAEYDAWLKEAEADEHTHF